MAGTIFNLITSLKQHRLIAKEMIIKVIRSLQFQNRWLFWTWLISLFLATGCIVSEHSPVQTVKSPKRQASVHLQEGFAGSAVTITYNDQVVYQGNPQEDQRLGFSDDFTFTIDDDPSGTLTLSLAGGLSGTFEADWSKGLDIGIGIQAGQVWFRHPGLFVYD